MREKYGKGGGFVMGQYPSVIQNPFSTLRASEFVKRFEEWAITVNGQAFAVRRVKTRGDKTIRR